MAKTSIIIPSRNERFLSQTIADIYNHATGDFEVIACLDGYWPDPPLENRKNLHILHWAPARGMRHCINAGAAVARGEYLMKTDGHCMFAQGFDEALQADIEDNWIVIPRRYALDAEAWAVNPQRPAYDYHYLTCPLTNPDGFSMHGKPWRERDRERLEIPIDENMSFQGSMWFMSRKHWDWLGGMSEEGYGGFCQEPQEIGNKTWLGGGQVMTNKKTWYAHLHKGQRYGRGYSMGKDGLLRGHNYSGHYWMENRWPERVHDMEWLVDKFWPVPTWPEDWKAQHESLRGREA